MDERTRDTMNDSKRVEHPNEDEPDFTSTFEGEVPEFDPQTNLEHVLSRPIDAHGEKVTVLRWREPTGGDIERAGNPIIVDFFGEKPSLTFNEKKMSAMMSLLAAVPPSGIKQLTAGDWNSIAWKLVRFFMPQTGPG